MTLAMLEGTFSMLAEFVLGWLENPRIGEAAGGGWVAVPLQILCYLQPPQSELSQHTESAF